MRLHTVHFLFFSFNFMLLSSFKFNVALNGTGMPIIIICKKLIVTDQTNLNLGFQPFCFCFYLPSMYLLLFSPVVFFLLFRPPLDIHHIFFHPLPEGKGCHIFHTLCSLHKCWTFSFLTIQGVIRVCLLFLKYLQCPFLTVSFS